MPYGGLITIFACVTLPERYSGVCMGVQHSCPDLLLTSPITANHTGPAICGLMDATEHIADSSDFDGQDGDGGASSSQHHTAKRKRSRDNYKDHVPPNAKSIEKQDEGLVKPPDF